MDLHGPAGPLCKYPRAYLPAILAPRRPERFTSQELETWCACQENVIWRGYTAMLV